uniref:Uncharacterized protein n=1 Tax=Tetranychus urticae TaxID=32264 RepID=T1JYN0_TETUR
MKFIYLLCLSFITFNYVKAEEPFDGFDDAAELSFRPREYYQVSTPDEKSPVVPSKVEPAYESIVTTVPSLMDRLFSVKQKIEKGVKDKIASIKQKKPEKVEKPKTTTPEPYVVYKRAKILKKIVHKNVEKPLSKDCKLIRKALFG